MGDDLSKASKVWQGLLTQSQLKQLGLSDEDGSKPKRARRKEAARPNSEASSRQPNEAIQLLIRLALRHEDSINVLMQEFQFTLFISPGEGSLFPTLLQTHQAWKANPSNLTLRHTMALKTVETLLERLTALQNSPVESQRFQECLQYQWINTDKVMPFLRWDASKQQLLPSKDKGLELGEVHHTVTQIHRILQAEPQLTLRFHALSNLKNTTTPTTSIPWLWTVGHQADGALWHLLRSISFHAVWQLVRASLRPQTQQRSQIAQQLQKQLG